MKTALKQPNARPSSQMLRFDNDLAQVGLCRSGIWRYMPPC